MLIDGFKNIEIFINNNIDIVIVDNMTISLSLARA